MARRALRSGSAARSDLHVKSLSKGLQVLALFSVDRPEWTLKSIVRETGFPRPTAYRLLRTLEDERFLVFDSGTSCYRLGPAMIPAMYLIQDEAHFLKVLHHDLLDLAEGAGEIASLGMEANNAVVMLDVVYGSDLAQAWVPVGRVQMGLSNAHAKVLTAFKDPEELAVVLETPQSPRTPHTVTDPAELAEEFARIVREGVAYDVEEHWVGICAVAAPVRDRTGSVVASVALVVPVKRFGPERRRAYTERLITSAATMSARLGYPASEGMVQP